MPSSRDAVETLVKEVLALGRYRQLIAPSIWQEQYRVLPEGLSARRGRWRNFPFQVEVFDSIIDPECHSLTLRWASQVLGKSSVLEGLLAWSIHQAPRPIVFIAPTHNNCLAWSKNRLGPMLQSVPVLRELVDDDTSRRGLATGYGSNTVSHKIFPGGFLLCNGSNSPANLRAHTASLCCFDECDAFPDSSGDEGDVITLTEQRSVTFSDAFSIKTSTPTLAGSSRIDKEFEQTDRRLWFVNCPKCGHQFVIDWANIRWPKDLNEKGEAIHHRIEEAYLECPGCQAQFGDDRRQEMVKAGRWIATRPEIKGKRGYHANAFITLLEKKRGYESWMHYWADRFFSAKRLGSTGLRTFQNLILGESYQIESEKPPEHTALYARREIYPEFDGEVVLPERSLFLVVGADVQADRIEAELVAYGLDEENWSIEYRIFRGNTETPTLFNQFDEWVLKKWRHPSGHLLNAGCVCIDAGNKPTQIYSYVARSAPRQVYAIKGDRGYDPTWVRRSGGRNQRLFILKVDTAKEALYSRLRLIDHGPGFCHFGVNESCRNDMTYFQQLCSESMHTTYSAGRLVRFFKLTAGTGSRNESLDARIYAMAAKEILNVDFPATIRSLEQAPLNDWRPEQIALAAMKEQADQAAALEQAPHSLPVNQPAKYIGPQRFHQRGWSKPY